MSSENTFASLIETLQSIQEERSHLLDYSLNGQEKLREKEIDDLYSTLHRLVVDTLNRNLSNTPHEMDTRKLRDGRYRGGNFYLQVDLRVDESVSGVISADFYRIGSQGQDYIASIRTSPGNQIVLSETEWTVIGQDEHGAIVSGKLSLTVTSTDPLTVVGVLFLDTALHGLPVRKDISFSAEWQSAQLRTIGIELEREQGVEPLPTFQFGSRPMNFDIALQEAGITVTNVGRMDEIPKNQFGWGATQLHTLLTDLAQASLETRAWEVHMLLLSRSTRAGLLGVMFDTKDQLQRQGAAVFVTKIREVAGTDPQVKLIQTVVHELGHALNLAHRFERAVGRADSVSYMNYDWRYQGGNRSQEFWSKFNFIFDKDELEFLRHAPLPALIPGGVAFHSVNYWADGNGGYSPYIPEIPSQDFRLTLSPPAIGPVFAFAQPVFLKIELTNLTNQPISISPFLLDPKTGSIEILIRRWKGEVGSTNLANASAFVPVYQRCFDVDRSTFDILQPGKSIQDNLNLTFGSGGFAFAEPGVYDVTALLVQHDERNQREFVVRSNALRIRVSAPKNTAEERDSMVLLRNDVGLYIALGGSDILSTAHDDLQKIRERRQGIKKIIDDPIVANIVRTEGINIGRPYIRFVKGKFSTRDGDRSEAAKLLKSLGNPALKAFDESTARETQRLAKKHGAAS